MRALKGLLMLSFMMPATSEAQIAIRPGHYETTLEMDLGAAAPAGRAVMDGAGFKKNKRLECITPEQVRGNDAAKIFARGMFEDGGNCRMSDSKTAGNKLTFTTTCEEDEIRMVMNTEVTFAADSFAGVTKTKMPDGHMSTMRMSARRIGECPK